MKDLKGRLDDIEDTVSESVDRPHEGIIIVNETDEGYKTLEGEDIPTTDDGTLDMPGDGLIIILPPEVTDNWVRGGI